MEAEPGIEVTVEDGIAKVLLQGEKSVNAFGRSLLTQFVRALTDLRQRPGVHVVVLSGPKGGSFQGGMNIAEMATLDAVGAREFITLLHQACHALRELPVPSIARIEGFCLGGGMEIAASCDLRLGATGSRYGMPEVQVGLPSVIEARLLPTLIGWGKTRELLYRGHYIDAVEAHRIGFLQAVAESHELDAAVAHFTADILRADPGAIRIQKHLLEHWLETPPGVGIQASIDAFAATFDTDAPNARLRAFLERSRARR
jgi:enoyl-CoA hydratase/carnithine racemase